MQWGRCQHDAYALDRLLTGGDLVQTRQGATAVGPRLLGSIDGTFLVPRYQRSYRWGPDEVWRLLEDIREGEGLAHFLPPLVVKVREDGSWELVDGQQRLATFYLILQGIKRTALPSAEQGYPLEYETRPGSRDYLDTVVEVARLDSIDYFHVYQSDETITNWFQSHIQQQIQAAIDFYTAQTLRHEITQPESKFWDGVVDLHAVIFGWYEDGNRYHKIGYLVATGHSFLEMVNLAQDKTKSEFHGELDELIRADLSLKASGVGDLSCDVEKDKAECADLLLMNVVATRKMQDSTERCSFQRHATVTWSLEHIHAQTSESLNRAEQWEVPLKADQAALLSLPGDSDADGQQRLTTLFLLRWHLAARTGNLDHPSVRQRLSYATCPIARKFCHEYLKEQGETGG